MRPPNRNKREGDSTQSIMSGFSAFQEPFAGFGGFEPFAAGFGGSPGGLISNMFDDDPFFSDPFFSRTFRTPSGAGGIFGPRGFLNSDIFRIGQHQGQGAFLEQRPYTSPAQGSGRNIPVEGSRRGGVTIEVPDDHDIVGAGNSNLNEEPIVEHPEDDDEKTETFRYHPRIDQLASSRPESTRQTQSPYKPVRTYSYQSSSVVYGGSNGPYYSAQTTRRQGPHGLIEEKHQVKDTTTGMESRRLSRGVHGKGRSITRKRNAEGREERLETLHNLEEDEVQGFEQTWEALVKHSLPKCNKGSASQTLGSSSKALPELPSSRSNRR